MIHIVSPGKNRRHILPVNILVHDGLKGQYFTQILLMDKIDLYPYLALTFSINSWLSQPLALAPFVSITGTPEWRNFHSLESIGPALSNDACTMVVVHVFWLLRNNGRKPSMFVGTWMAKLGAMRWSKTRHIIYQNGEKHVYIWMVRLPIYHY